jgi:hypothetical protein
MNSIEKDPDQAWLNQLTEQLRESEEKLDYVVETKLTAARARAIAETPVNTLRQRLGFTVTALAGLAICFLVVRTFQPGLFWSEAPSLAQNNLQFEHSIDLPILSSNEDLEFFESLDFIEWIDQRDLTSG